MIYSQKWLQHAATSALGANENYTEHNFCFHLSFIQIKLAWIMMRSHKGDYCLYLQTWFIHTVSDRSRRGSSSHLHIINCRIWGEVPAWCVLVSGIFHCSIAPGEVWGAAVAAVPSVRPVSGCIPGPGHTALDPVWTEIVQTDWTHACKHTNKTCTS